MDPEKEAAKYDESVWHATRRIPVYNAHLLFAAVPQTRNAFFQAEWRPVRGISHMVIGASAEKTGLRHEDSEESQRRLVHFLCQMIARGVRMNHSLFEPAEETAAELSKPKRKDLMIGLDFQAASAACGSLQLDLSDEPFPKWMINENPELFSPYSSQSGVVSPSDATLRENEDILRTPRMFADDELRKKPSTPNSNSSTGPEPALSPSSDPRAALACCVSRYRIQCYLSRQHDVDVRHACGPHWRCDKTSKLGRASVAGKQKSDDERGIDDH